MSGFFERFRHGRSAAHDEAPARTVVEIDASSLSRVFSAPMWLRDLGLLSWFLVGLGLLLVGLVWLLGLTSTIVEPVLVGAILATVAGPLVTKMQRRRIPRAAGAAVVLLGLLALGVLIALLVFGGIVEQSSELTNAAAQMTVEDLPLQSRRSRVGQRPLADEDRAGHLGVQPPLATGVADLLAIAGGGHPFTHLRRALALLARQRCVLAGGRQHVAQDVDPVVHRTGDPA